MEAKYCYGTWCRGEDHEWEAHTRISDLFYTRAEAEAEGLKEAFGILEKKLTK